MRHFWVGATIASMICLSLATALVAGDLSEGKPFWPQWRGPNRDGVATEKSLLKKWSEEGPPLAWKVGGLGSGYSSVAVADGKIFTLGKRSGSEFLIAIDENGHKELWAARLGRPWNDGPRSTPTVDGDRVYAVGPHGDLICVSTAQGKEIWRRSFAKDFGGRMMSGWGFCESPLIDGDKLLCTPGGAEHTIVSLNKMTGEETLSKGEKWKCSVPEIGPRGRTGAGYSSIVISEACNHKQYVQLFGKGVVGIDAETGKFLWGYNRVANGTANIPTPVIRGDYVFCSTGYGTGSALLHLVKDGDGIKAEEKYFLDAKTLQNHHGGLVLIGDHIYGGHGHNNGFPICVEMLSGKIVWRKDRGPGTGSAAVVAADGQLYFRYQNGKMALISATPEGYHLNGEFQIPNVHSPSWAHPVVAGGKLYLREQDDLLVYNVSTDSK